MKFEPNIKVGNYKEVGYQDKFGRYVLRAFTIATGIGMIYTYLTLNNILKPAPIKDNGKNLIEKVKINYP